MFRTVHGENSGSPNGRQPDSRIEGKEMRYPQEENSFTRLEEIFPLWRNFFPQG